MVCQTGSPRGAGCTQTVLNLLTADILKPVVWCWLYVDIGSIPTSFPISIEYTHLFFSLSRVYALLSIFYMIFFSSLLAINFYCSAGIYPSLPHVNMNSFFFKCVNLQLQICSIINKLLHLKNFCQQINRDENNEMGNKCRETGAQRQIGF